MPSTIYPFSDRGSAHPDKTVEGKMTALTLTNAQVKALAQADSAGAIEVVPAPGEGKIIVAGAYVDGSGVVLKSSIADSGDYTNVNAAATLRFMLGDATGPRATIINEVVDALLAPGVEGEYAVVCSAGEHLDSADAQDAAALEVFANQPLMLDMPNDGDGALTGGDADNSLTVCVSYYVIEVA